MIALKKVNKTRTFYNHNFPIPHYTEYGFSIYRGVLVQWDEDHDERILTFLDSLPASILDELVIACEHEAHLMLRWTGATPNEYRRIREVGVDGDVWTVESKCVGKPSKPNLRAG